MEIAHACLNVINAFSAFCVLSFLSCISNSDHCMRAVCCYVLSFFFDIPSSTSPNSPGRIHTRACRCSWRPPTGSGSARSDTYLHESKPLSPRTWASLSHGPCKGAKRSSVPAETRSIAETASTTCRPPEIRGNPARTRDQSRRNGSEIFSDQRNQTLRVKERAGEHAGQAWMWKALQVSRSTFNKQREIKSRGAQTQPTWNCVYYSSCLAGTANPS